MNSNMLLRWRRHILTRPPQRRRSMRSWSRPSEPTAVSLRRLRLADLRVKRWLSIMVEAPHQNGENQ
jgi:hypothetical protein